MAKKRSAGGINKSEKIREYFQDHPDAGAKEVVDALKGQGIDVSTPQVYNIRSQMKGGAPTKGRGRGRGRGRKPAAAAASAAPAAAKSSPKGDVSVEGLMQAKKLVDQMGGVENAKKALDVLSHLNTK